MKLNQSDNSSISTNCSSKPRAINFIKRNKMNVANYAKKRIVEKFANKWNCTTKIDDNYYKRKPFTNPNHLLPISLQIANEIISTSSDRQNKNNKKTVHDELKNNLLDSKVKESFITRENKLDPQTWLIGSNVEPLQLSNSGYSIEKYPQKIARLGIIFNGIRNSDKSQFIIKMINKNALIEKNLSKLIFPSLSTQMQLNNINILHVEDLIQEDEHLYIVMENASRGSLRNLIQLNPGTLSFEHVANYVVQIAQVLDYLHQNNIAHLGITSGSILIAESINSAYSNDFYKYGVVKLSNFIYSVNNADKIKQYSNEDIEYLAPEVIENKEFSGFKVDIWSFGILIFELLTGRHPFNQYTSKEYLSKQIMSGDIKFPINTPLPQEAMELVIGMCQYDPNQRLGLKELQTNVWINKLINC